MLMPERFICPGGTELYVVNTGDWRYQRPVTDEKKCRTCGVCWILCPVQCRYEKDNQFDTNLDFCKGCGLCAAECPALAIQMVNEER